MKKPSSSLKLNRETVRPLTPSELAEVGGGTQSGTSVISVSGPSVIQPSGTSVISGPSVIHPSGTSVISR